MSDKDSNEEVARLRRAIRRVIDAAKAESTAMSKAIEDCAGEAMRSLHDSHLDELNAIQALVASLELFDRRLAGQSRP